MFNKVTKLRKVKERNLNKIKLYDYFFPELISTYSHINFIKQYSIRFFSNSIGKIKSVPLELDTLSLKK
jgi:hypothetical protein